METEKKALEKITDYTEQNIKSLEKFAAAMHYDFFSNGRTNYAGHFDLMNRIFKRISEYYLICAYFSSEFKSKYYQSKAISNFSEARFPLDRLFLKADFKGEPISFSVDVSQEQANINETLDIIRSGYKEEGDRFFEYYERLTLMLETTFKGVPVDEIWESAKNISAEDVEKELERLAKKEGKTKKEELLELFIDAEKDFL